MNRRRIGWLVAVMLVLLAARLWTWSSHEPPPVVDAVTHATPIRARTPASAPTDDTRPRLASAEAAGDDDATGNPFAPRHPTPAPVVAAPPPVAVAPPAAVPDPEPPYQVIGTFDDSESPGVFVSTAHGVEIVHLGTVLDAEFKVTAMSPRSITLEHLTSKRRYTIGMPAGESP